MRHRNRNYLFCDGDLNAALRVYFDKVRDHVDAIPEERFLSADLDELVNGVEAEFQISSLTLDEDHRTVHRHETKVDVSGDLDRYFSNRPGPHHVPGFRLDFAIPFGGDPGLWKLKPNRWRSTTPFEDVEADPNNTGGHLKFSIEYPADQGPESAKARYEDNIKDIRFYLESQKPQIEAENAKLRELVTAAIERRKTRLKQQENLDELFSVPVQKASATATTRTGTGPTKRAKPRKLNEWDVFISHASEDKEAFVRPLAQLLKQRGLSVWFDEFSLRVGDSLRRSIDRGLAGAKFGVVVISPDFLQKEWPQKELDALIGR